MFERGFTLIELLIGLAVVGVLLALGVPLVQDAFVNARLKAAATAFSSGIQYARSQAVSGNETVWFRQQPAGSLGWQVVLPKNDARQLVSDPSKLRDQDEVIQERAAGESGSSSVTVGFVGTPFTRIEFNGLGRANFVGGGAVGEYRISNPTHGACVDAGGPVRCLNIAISQGGQVRLCDPAVTDSADTRHC
ncbi:MAG: GspH/FimT family pseudopilin [Azonexus sp.]|nr:GspH/FimT family pseudopilin [Azonexus sp.]